MNVENADSPVPPVDLTQVFDAVVVGSGAAGGMAAYVLTQHGLNVLLLEAGAKQNVEEILRSQEWPYEHPTRARLSPNTHALSFNEYTIRDRPYAKSLPHQKVTSYMGGSEYRKDLLVNEKDHPTTGTPYAWVRARTLGGKTNIWGRLSLRMGDLDLKAKSHDGYGEDWPISYADLSPYYDRVDRLLGIIGHPEKLPHVPDGLYNGSSRLNYAELKLRKGIAPMGRVATPYRAGVTAKPLPHNRYRSRCLGRGACDRKGGCDIHAAFDSPTGLIYPAMETGKLSLRTNATAHEVTVDKNTGKASGISFVDTVSKKTYQVKARAVVLAASTLESTRLLLLSKSAQHPNGIANSSGHVGHNFSEHIMGPGVTGFCKDLVGQKATLDDGRPGGYYIPRFRNLEKGGKNRSPFLRGYGFEGASGSTMFPKHTGAAGFGSEYKKQVRERSGAFISMGGFGEMLPRFENHVRLDPLVKDRWGIPVLRFQIQFGDNEKKMAEDMANTAQEMMEAAGIEVVHVDRKLLTEGWSIHELGTARMGHDPKTSVLNPFQQAHDVKNLFVVDGSSHVSASAQNPTWSIMALAWRSCDYLATEMRKGNL
jgi:choline dehydrogenase-like flavoprotein